MVQKDFDVFLSYASPDRDKAAQIEHLLTKAGLAVFWDREAIHSGDNWLRALEDALASCRSFTVLIGSEGTRRWVGAEVAVALTRHFDEECED